MTAHSVAGSLHTLDPIRSRVLGNERPLYVWVPASYEAGDRRYPVLYMQDGQNLFDPSQAFGDEWQVDENMARLAALGLEAIVVGIPNAGEARIDEYSPFVDGSHGGGRGEQYLAFVIEEVKPLIDQRYRTVPGREGTGIMGSSMGGLISLYAFFRHPVVFGYAGAMSPSLWFAEGAMLRFIERTPFVDGRVYLDMGTAEGGRHVAQTHALHRLLLEKGYRQGVTLFYVEEDHAPHAEEAWARRLRIALYFLLPPIR